MLFQLSSLLLLLPFVLTADTTGTSGSSTGSSTEATHKATQPATTSSSQTYSAANTDQYSSWSTELKSLLTDIDIPPLFPSPTRKLNISIPQTLLGPLMTAVPASVVLNLIGEKYRVSVQKQFAQKDYPDWYKTMDPKAKEFVENFAESLQNGKTAVFVTETDQSGPTQTDTKPAAETTAEDDATRVLDRSVLMLVFGVAGVAAMLTAL